MIGIITAIEAEFQSILQVADFKYSKNIAGMDFCTLLISDTEVTLVKSGVGKVNAAMAAQILIDQFKVDRIINVGVGGALVDSLTPGEIVISTDAVQYDFDARAFGHKRGEVPNTDRIAFPASKALVDAAETAAERLKYSYTTGRILTADIGLSDNSIKEDIVATFSGLICEMEGAAILQVTYLNGIEGLVIRSVSDNADENASKSYRKNLRTSAQKASALVVEMLSVLKETGPNNRPLIRATRAEINLDNLIENYRNIKKRAEDKKICAVVKADAYGHGLEAIRALDEENPDYFAVACLEEGIALREAGITRPILILGYTFPERIEELIEYNIEPTIFTYEDAEKISNIAKERGIIQLVHLKIDTGMKRIGMDWDTAEEEIERISQLPNIEINGLFTHLCTADSKDKTFTTEQLKRFERLIKVLETKGITPTLIHAENSAAIVDLEVENKDMVRPGIILYGHYPSDEVITENLKIKPVMRFLSKIIQIKTLEPGEGIGYGRAFVADKKMRVATFSAGYADGFSRILSRKGADVIINGQRAPILGNICMDQAFADVTNIKDVKVGDDVEIFGEEMTAEEYAEFLGTIPYEVTCMVSKRVPRVYKRGGSIIKVVEDILEKTK